MDTPDQGKMQAAADLTDIIELRRSKAFERYFLREARNEVERLTLKLTTEDMTDAATKKAQGELKVWRKMLNKLRDDFQVNHGILNPDGEDSDPFARGTFPDAP